MGDAELPCKRRLISAQQPILPLAEFILEENLCPSQCGPLSVMQGLCSWQTREDSFLIFMGARVVYEECYPMGINQELVTGSWFQQMPVLWLPAKVPTPFIAV